MNLESQDKSIDPATGKLVVFEDKQIRRVFHNGEWHFSIIDIVEVLTGSPNPRRYWSNLKIQLSKK
jgi:DNA-damage-inducible protein D